YKGVDYVIRALPLLLGRFPNLVYHVIGDGDDRPRLERLAVEHGVQAAVRFAGILPDADLLRHYAGATIYVMPSRGEGFGFVFLEAMAQGTPAIGGNVDATPEVIVDGVTGYLIDPTSPDAIAAAVARLLDDPPLPPRLAQ